MVGIELVADRKTKKPYTAQERIGHRVILEARKHGVIIRPLGDVIVLMPPLAIREKEIDTLCSVVFDAIRTVTETVIATFGSQFIQNLSPCLVSAVLTFPGVHS